MYLNTPKLKIEVRSPSIDVSSLNLSHPNLLPSTSVESTLLVPSPSPGRVRMENNITLYGRRGGILIDGYVSGMERDVLIWKVSALWFQVFIPPMART